MRSKVIPIALVAAFLASACSSTPAPTNRPTASPTLLACPGPQSGDPGYVSHPADDLIVNGNFGDPPISGQRTVTSLPGWAVSGKVELVASTFCLPFPDNQYVSLPFGSAVSQTVPTTRGTTYNLTLSDTRYGDCSTAGSELDVYWNAQHVTGDIAFAQGTTPVGGPSVAPWGAYGTATASAVATAATAEVRFVVTNASVSCRFLLSNISLVVRPKATPAA